VTRFASPSELLGRDGAVLGTSDWLGIDQRRINGFADNTDDHQWIHVDVERAKAGPFGTTIAHGYLTLALAPTLLQQVVVIDDLQAAVNYGLNKVRFPAPVPVDSRIRATVALVGATQKGPSVEAVFGLTVEIEDGTRPACVAEVVVHYT
jgi:acyl dehydratase